MIDPAVIPDRMPWIGYREIHLMLLTAVLLTLASPVQAQANTTATKPDSGEKLVCKRVQEIGKLASRKRVCLTPAEWDQVSRQGQELGRSMQPALTTPSQ